MIKWMKYLNKLCAECDISVRDDEYIIKNQMTKNYICSECYSKDVRI